jgi:diguanylate cyclase (GGDEF)-like protein/PAS domain S-box-containing protein
VDRIATLPLAAAVTFFGVALAAIAMSLRALRPSATRDWTAMRPSFVAEFTSLLLFGPQVTMLVAAAGAATRALADRHAQRPWRALLDTATAITAVQAAGWAARTLGGTTGHFVWPWQAVPVAASAVGYAFVITVTTTLVTQLIAKRPINRSSLSGLLAGWPIYILGATIAAGLAQVMSSQSWELLPVAAVPLYLSYRVYRDYENRLEHEHRHRRVIDSLRQGMCVVDNSGKVTFWNDALEELLDCPRGRIVGHPLRTIPGLAVTELPRAVEAIAAEPTARALPQVAVPSANGPRILHVTIVPDAADTTLVWHDVTDHTRAEWALKRQQQRLALAADGASDGLWEWDLRAETFYVTARWRAMLGLPTTAGIMKPAEWLERVHADDLASLKEAIEAHLSGDTDHFQHEHRIRHEDGSYRLFLSRGIAAARSAGRRPTRIAGSLTDTTDRAITEERLRNVVFLDPLTGLCNRAVFVEQLGRRLTQFKQRKGRDPFAVLYLDLDRFKVVNDSLGHLVGDELLIAVSRRLESCLRQGDVLARLGGDEFSILLNGLQSEEQANVVAFRVQEALSKPFSIGGREVFTSASIGIAFGLAQYTNPDEIMHDADTAMYQAKARGKARHQVFDADMDARARDRLGLENDLRHAVEWNDFELHYQPIVSLDSGMCVGFESLVRWTRHGTAVSPATFIPIAEELGLIEPLGTWVLQQACRTFAAWQRQFPDAGLDCITVNVSSRQLMQQNFLSIVEQAVGESGLRPRDLRIEITETALMDSPSVAAKVLSQLRTFGAKIYLDDFGTGYSSLSHLHKLPVDALKIDRSFVRSLLLPDRPAIVESILALARTLNTSVVAEGIETDQEAFELERLGCTHAQGFLFSRPLSTQAAEQVLSDNRPLGPKRLSPPDATANADLESCYSSIRVM